MIENFTTDILDVNISDHQFIHLHRQHMPKTKTKMDFVGRSYKNYNKNTFCENLTKLDWNEYYACNNPNNAWKIMVNHIVYTLDKMCPLKRFKIAQEKEPWISNEILEKIKDKDRLLRRAKNRNTEQDWDIAKNCRNRTNYLIRQAKANFINENINNSQNSAKKFWQNIKDVLPNSKDIKTSKISLRDENLNFIQNNKEMADSLNMYFTNIGPSLATNMHDPWHYTGNLIESVLEDDFSIEMDDLIKLFQEIDITKSSAIEYLSSNILKDAFICLINQMTFLYNLSFNTGIFPDDWKMAQTTSLPKDGDLTQCNNYRPISLLPLPGKIAEKIAHNRPINYLEFNEILNKKQGGFRKNSSTINSISEFTHEMFSAINNRDISLATFIDFSKAFDTVNHKILINKLRHYGINGKNLSWVENYLLNRKQCTIVNGKSSDYLDVTYGVPQGVQY